MDPLAEHSQDQTPYHFCSNNPINRIDPDGKCDDPNCPHKSGIENNGMSIVENFLWDMRDKAVSGLVTVGTYLANKATDGAFPVFEAKFTYGSDGRVGKLSPVLSNRDLAAVTGTADVIAAIPGGGPAGAFFSKVVGAKAAVVDGIKALGEVAETANNSAKLSSNGVKLTKQLASESQMSEVGKNIIQPVRNGTRLSEVYGGSSKDWAKKKFLIFQKWSFI